MNLDLSLVEPLVLAAIKEDLGPGDVTCQAMVPEDAISSGAFALRRDGVIAGLPVAQLVYARISAKVEFKIIASEGARLPAGSVVARVRGPARAVLAGERTALNFLQRMSGVATLTRRCVDAIQGTACIIQDTRKTIPGWRYLDKYAVRAGGGVNHRQGLYDQVLIKDNHLRLAALTGASDPVIEAVRLARQRAKPGIEIEVECDTPDQVRSAIASGADIIMLDNMDNDTMRACAAWVRQARQERNAPRPVTEASGGIAPDRLASVAATGVDRISLGALTHSAPALDIALDFD